MRSADWNKAGISAAVGTLHHMSAAADVAPDAMLRTDHLDAQGVML